MALQHVKNLLKLSIESKGFDRVLEKIKVISADNGGNLIAEMKVEEEHTNVFQTLHGGMTATIVDVLTSLGHHAHPKGSNPSLSANINISYMNPAKIGDVLVITANTLKAGKTLAFLEVKITEKTSGKIIASGSHTKFVLV